MTAPRNWIHAGLFCVLAASASLAHAQTYPSGPVRFITPLPAGGGTDPAMRIVIDHLGKMWGQQTALVNQPGAGGALAVRTAAAAPPDAQTLLMAIASTYTSLPENQPDLVSPVNDLIPVGFVGEVPMAIAVTPALPVNSVPELVALSKKQAGGLNVALALRGGTTHLMTELLRIRSGADLTPVFYPAGAQALSDVISGRVQMTIDGLSGPVGGGQVRLLAIASHERVPSHADIPTVSETVPGFTATGWVVLAAPPRTPPALVNKVREDLHAVLARDDVRQKFGTLSFSTRPMTPPALSAFIQSERDLWKPVIRRLSLTP